MSDKIEENSELRVPTGMLVAKPGHLSVPNDFLGTPGHAPSNRDCPGQTGTYGHLV